MKRERARTRIRTPLSFTNAQQRKYTITLLIWFRKYS